VNELQIFNNPEFGTLRGFEIDDEAWFVGIDVARALGYSNQYGAIARHVDEDDLLKREVIDNLGRAQQTNLINEAGVLSLILMSELPSAKKFKRWVTKEVLPSILKTGSYNLPQLTQNELIAKVAQANVDLEKRMGLLEDTQTEIKQKLDTAIRVLSSPNQDCWKTDIDNSIKEIVTSRHLSPYKFRGLLYSELEETGISLESRVGRMRTRMKREGATYKHRMAVTKLDVISSDKQLRKIFEGIVKKHQALCQIAD